MVIMQEIKKKIRFGLTAIKGLGEDTVDVIIAERNNNGKFKSLQDFAKRVPAKLMNKKTLEALTFSGAFDSFGDRGAIADSLEDLSRFAREQEKQAEAGQIGLFGGTDEAAVEFMLKDTKATKEDILRWERESLGLFVSDHPLKGLGGYFKKYGNLIGNLTEDDNENNVTLHGIVTMVRKIVTKRGKNMAILEVEDTSGKIECAIFPAIYEKVPAAALEKDTFIRIKGKVNERNGMMNCIVDEIKIGDLKNIQKMAEAFIEKPEEISKTEEDNIYTVEIVDGTTNEQVDEIKKTLILLKSPNPEDMTVMINIQGKAIELPFKIHYTTEVEDEINAILKN